MIGPVVPLPVPQKIIESLESLQVTTASDSESGFQLSFTFNSNSILNNLIKLLPQTGPFIRVIITVIVNGQTNVLIDGVITNHEIAPDLQPGKSTVSFTGSDLSAVMNLADLSGLPYPATTVEARVLLILAKYAAFGIIPKVIPVIFRDTPNPLDKIPAHQGNDLEYIKMLAEENGYVFYIEPGSNPGTSYAYWGPEIKIGIPQPPLNINMDAQTNVESINFTMNGDKKTLPVTYVQNKETKIPIPIPVPDISSINPSLGSISTFTSKIEQLKDTAKQSPLKALGTALKKASESSDVVSATGRLDVLRYGRLLKARQLVTVRGAGSSYNGAYYVKQVTHEIKRGDYRQSFTLSRNALGSLLSKVPL